MLLQIWTFLISFFSSAIGSITGIGGGVIIKPVLDATGLMTVSTISFLSGCTVLSMSTVSLLRARGNGVYLDVRKSSFLAIGSAIGGIVGKMLFEQTKRLFGQDHLVGALQAGILLVMTIWVLFYVLQKDRIRKYQINNRIACLLIGLGLGMLSAFLGIGGGPINLAILYLLFSMDAKTAAKNSLYIILFSQIASLASTLIGKTVPEFGWQILLLMVAGGIGGALLGSGISKKLNTDGVQKAFLILLFLIIGINVWNLLRFLGIT